MKTKTSLTSHLFYYYHTVFLRAWRCKAYKYDMAEESQTETSVGNGTGRDPRNAWARGEFESLAREGPPPLGCDAMHVTSRLALPHPSVRFSSPLPSPPLPSPPFLAARRGTVTRLSAWRRLQNRRQPLDGIQRRQTSRTEAAGSRRATRRRADAACTCPRASSRTCSHTRK